VRYTPFFLVVWIVMLVGCDRSSSTEQQKPYLMTQKRVIPHTKEVSETKAISRAEERITLSAMEAAHQEKMATIAAEKEKQLKALCGLACEKMKKLGLLNADWENKIEPCVLDCTFEDNPEQTKCRAEAETLEDMKKCAPDKK